jgi:hypothetical protein
VFENRVLRRIFGPKMEKCGREIEKHASSFVGLLYSRHL